MVVYLERVQRAHNVLHQHAPPAAQLHHPELLLHPVGQGVDEVDGGRLQEHHQPRGHHLPEQRRDLGRSDEVALPREHVLVAVVAQLLVRQSLLPVL